MPSSAQRTLFVDLDGTVMLNPFWPVVFPTVCAGLAARSGVAEQRVLDMIIGENRRRRDAASNAAWAMDWDDIIGGVAQELGVPCIDSAEQLVREYAAPPHTTLIDEADRVLHDIGDQGWRIIAATHGLSKYQRPVLAALGLLPLFQGINSPDSRHCFKQERAFWQPYLDQDGACIHVGDLWEDDVAAPHRYGILTIWKRPLSAEEPALQPEQRAQRLLRPGDTAGACDAVIGDLHELPATLARLASE
jgi:putative hydrolase of the HAD superfamily